MAPTLRWQPSSETIQHANLTAYFDWLRKHPAYQIDLPDYQAAWQWSVDAPARFWASIADYFDIPYQAGVVLSGEMPHARWFEGTMLNYAEQVFRRATDAVPAILFQSETQALQAISWAELHQQVAAFSTWLRSVGVQPGDRVVGYLPNIPQATVALLATLAVGAVWSSASPDFGLGSVQERFGQISPKILIAVDGYHYGGKAFDKMEVVEALREQIGSLEQVVVIGYLDPTPNPSPEGRGAYDLDALGGTRGGGKAFLGERQGGREDSGKNLLGRGSEHNRAKTVQWEAIMANVQAPLVFTPVPFDHPIWVLYSSGTTGLPKAITHSQGGMLLEHLKYLVFHNDVHPGERFFWYTTTGWMMWNFVNAALLARATIVLYDGSPAWPDLGVLWELAQKARIHHFGTSAAFILSCLKSGISLQPDALPDLRSIGSTGSPLPPEGFAWVYEQLKPNVWLSSMSGGTDVCTAWVGGNPLLPVWEGEIQCRCLGCAMEAWDEAGHPLQNEVGEMVVTKPMPCMPVFFWNDPEGTKYRSSYFEDYPGVWRHGDWLKITDRQTLVILGRSDATLNRHGIRIGTSEIYRTVETLVEIRDSLIVNLEKPDGTSFMPLFVVLAEGAVLDAPLKKKIAQALRNAFSPRHVPDEVFAVPEIPYTISGKKMELPIKKILMGKALEQSVNIDAVRNPAAVRQFEGFKF